MSFSRRYNKSNSALSRRTFIGSVAATSLYGFVPLIFRNQAASAAPVFSYYISPTGSNSNVGSAASPWALSALKTKSEIAGKAVGLLDGTYVVSDTTGLSANENDPFINLSFGGTAASPTIIEAVNHQRVTITTNNGGNYPPGTLPLFRVSGNYITLRGLKIKQLAFYAIMVSGSHTVIEDCEISDIVFSRCGVNTADNCGGIGTGDDGTDLLIKNCSIHDIYQDGTSTGPNNSCIGPMYNHSNIVVEHCTIYNSGSAISPKRNMGGLVVRNNHIYAMHHYAIRSMVESDPKYSTAPNQIYNNLFVNVPCISGANDPEAGMNPVNTNFTNNTVVFSNMNNAGSGLIQFNGAGNTAGIKTANKYYNNIFYLPPTINAPNDGVMFWYTGTNNRAVDRLSVSNWNCWGNDASKIKLKDSTGTYTTMSAWQSATGFDVNSLVTDPQFVNGAGTSPNDFRLRTGSPCTTSGRVGGTSAGAAIEMGAWGGATSIGADFGPKPVAPVAPQTTVS